MMKLHVALDIACRKMADDNWLEISGGHARPKTPLLASHRQMADAYNVLRKLHKLLSMVGL